MNKIYNPKPETWSEILKRPTQTIEDIELTVKEIFKEVQKKGDEAVARYTSLFDGVKFGNIEVTQIEIEQAISLVSAELKNAIQLAKSNIEKFQLKLRLKLSKACIAGKKKDRFKKWVYTFRAERLHCFQPF